MGHVDRGRGALLAQPRIAGLGSGQRFAAPIPVAADRDAGAKFSRGAVQPCNFAATGAVASAKRVSEAFYRAQAAAAAARASGTAAIAGPGYDLQHAGQCRNKAPPTPR